MPIILSGNVATATADVGYSVANSCRLNQADSPKMTRVNPSEDSTDQDEGTYSWWMKPTTESDTQYIITVEKDNERFLWYYNNNTFAGGYRDSDSSPDIDFVIDPAAVFRDPAAWYHCVLAHDTDQATAANRLRFYVNNVEYTVTQSAELPSGQVLPQNKNAFDKTTLFATSAGGNNFDGYIAEFVFIDGQQLTPSSFGEYSEDSPNVWMPKDVSELTFGNLGYYLDFEDSDNLGDDESGNGDDFSETNLAAADQATDSPTNNFCVMSPLYKHTNFTFSEANCKMVTGGSDAYGGGIGTFGLTAGKWYWEVKIASTVGNHNHGAISELCPELYDLTEHASATGALQIKTGVTCWLNDDGGEVRVDGTATTADYGIMADGSIMGIALDMDNYNISYYDDGTALVTDFNMSTTRGTIFPFINTGVSTTTEVNFGGCSAFAISSAANDANGHGVFEHAPPSGYLALCSKNLGSDGG